MSITVFFRMCTIFLKRLLNIKLYALLWASVICVLCLIIISINKDESVSKTKIELKNPVILWWTNGFPGTSMTKTCINGIKCDIINDRNLSKMYEIRAYLFYGSNIDFDVLPLPRRPAEKIWGLYHEESPRNVEELMHEEVLKLFNFSSTFSRFSDVPFTLQFLDSLQTITSKKYFVKTAEKNALLNELSPIMYLQSDCETSTERDAYVEEVMKHIKVDSYGICLNNKQLPAKFKVDYLNNLDEDEFLKFIARYKFVIAIENGICEDYVTEKLWRAINMGIVPIYFGSPSVRDWLPNVNSSILLQDYDTPEKLVKHIEELMKNDTMYEQYLQHKIKSVITNERLIYEFHNKPWASDAFRAIERFECFVCEKVHEKLNGKLPKSYQVDKRHYECPKPISALTLKVNPTNDWVFSWQNAGSKAKELHRKILNEN